MTWYAGAGVPEYWVVDVPGRQVHPMTLPAAGGYEREAVAGTGDRVQPQHVGVHPLHVADSFAGL